MSANRFRDPRGQGARLAVAIAADGAATVGRGLAPLVKVGLLLSFVGLLGWTIHTAVLRSAYFRVRVVEANETAHLDRRAIVDLMGLGEPVNLFRFDPQAAEDALASHPWVARARVRTVLPDRVEAEIEERTPAGVLVLDSLFLVDDTGSPVVPADPADARALPLITGLTRQDYERDDEGTRARLRQALAVARVYAQSPLAALRPLSDVHLAPGGRTELMLGRTRVVLGQHQHRKKIELLLSIFTQLSERKVDAAYILLSEDLDRAVVQEVRLEQEFGSISLRPGGVGDHGER